MSPNLRRAAHQALDLILDAWAEEQRAESAPKRRRGQVTPLAIEMPELSPEKKLELEEQLDRQMRRNGYRKAG